ncbi:hypothetical protein LCGC14_0798110 [marine sediment metagenome]|uniref:Uncharacterized protein n=1 Tax=marine sediment metagenome TaxID=412755 RepID=A0A0F9SXQ1_9ZZZZ
MPDAPFQTCPTCGTPKIERSHALVLYFRNDADREEFAAVVKAEMPNATVYPVGSGEGQKNG